MADEPFPPFVRVLAVNGTNHTHDQGTMSLGLRPVFTDLINGATDPYGNPLSQSRQYWNYVKNGNDSSFVVDPDLQRAINAGTPQALGLNAGNFNDFTLLGVDGAAKAPMMRNVALTPPYFSWGGYPSLRQALKLYNRGFNRRDINPTEAAANKVGCTTGDNSGTGPEGNSTYDDLKPGGSESNCGTNATGAITPLGLIDCDQTDAAMQLRCQNAGMTPATDDLAALEAFLKALTDPRLQCDQAPFDHPSLKVLNGHKTTDANGDGKADDIIFNLPAVGAAGYPRGVKSFCIPNAGDLFAPGMQSRSGGAKVIVP